MLRWRPSAPSAAITMRVHRSEAMARQRTLPLAAVLCATACMVSAAGQFKLPFGEWQRASQQPVLSPQGRSWESAGVFNPAVVKVLNEYFMLYRAQDSNGTSRLGYATSRD